MKCLKINLLIYLFVLVSIQLSFAKEVGKNLSHYKQVELPYSSSYLKKYYYLDKMIGIKINPVQLFSINFNDDDREFNPKLSEGFAKGKTYYPLIYFYYKSILYKGIIYQGYADNDMSTFIFQLTSYDTDDNIIDSILLDARFRFEIMYWNNFKIDKDGKIFIVMCQQEVHNYSEDSFNVSGKVNSVKLEYEMGNDGFFKQIK